MTCSNSKHVWKAKGAAEVCITCHTRFPCKRVACGHVDCHEARGEPPPHNVVVVDKAARAIPIAEMMHVRAPGVVRINKPGAVAYTDGIDQPDDRATAAALAVGWPVAPEIQGDRERSATPEVQAALAVGSLQEILGLAKPPDGGTPDA